MISASHRVYRVVRVSIMLFLRRGGRLRLRYLFSCKSISFCLLSWSAQLLCIYRPWDDYGNASLAHTQQQTITNTFIPSLKKITPTSGAYLNEADAFDPQWKQTFYGSNYAKLLSIKDKWDPAQMLYGSTAVGGDRWKEDGEGRLCRV